jgi:hypothetical protein
MEKLTRRNFLTQGSLLLAGGTILARAAQNGSTITLTFPAKQMAGRASVFRNTFLNDYFVPKKPFPIYSVLAQSGLLPDDISAERSLGGCGSFIFNNGTATFSNPPKSDIILPYHVELAGQSPRNNVTIPAHLKIVIQQTAANAGLSFTFDPPINVKQIDRLKLSNGIVAPIPEIVLVSAVQLDQNALHYDCTSSGNGIKYEIVLDFTQATGDPRVSLGPAHGNKANWALNAFALLLSIGLIGCVNNMGNTTGGPAPPTPTPYPDKEVCYNAPVPTGFVRIDSQPAGLSGCPSTGPTDVNVFIYKDYVDQPSKTQFAICSDAPIPPGYIDISGPYHDDHGCDYLKYQGTPYDNSRLIYKTG